MNAWIEKYIPAASGLAATLFLIALIATALIVVLSTFAGDVFAESVKGLTETMARGSAGTPGGGGFPCGIFGKDYCDFAGSGDIYSYNPDDFPSGPPSSVSNMGPGSVGTNGDFTITGSGILSGEVLMTEGKSFRATGSTKVGTKLTPPRNPSGASDGYTSGSPARPGDTGYECVDPYIPLWDKDGDGDTDGDDYAWVIANGGPEGGGSSIPLTVAGDATIRKNSSGSPGAVAVAGKSGDYDISSGVISITGSKSLHFTGTHYRFAGFQFTGSGDIYFGTGGNNTDLYCDNNFSHTGSGNIHIAPGKTVFLCPKLTFQVTGSGDFNKGGHAMQLDVVSPGSTFNITGSGDSLAGCFYVPNAAVDISGSGNICTAIIAKSITNTGSGDHLYPTTYEGPRGGSGVPVPARPHERVDWRELNQ
jgi:hypothetical protein